MSTARFVFGLWCTQPYTIRTLGQSLTGRPSSSPVAMPRSGATAIDPEKINPVQARTPTYLGEPSTHRGLRSGADRNGARGWRLPRSGFCQPIPDRGHRTGLCEPFGVADGQILDPLAVPRRRTRLRQPGQRERNPQAPSSFQVKGNVRMKPIATRTPVIQ